MLNQAAEAHEPDNYFVSAEYLGKAYHTHLLPTEFRALIDLVERAPSQEFMGNFNPNATKYNGNTLEIPLALLAKYNIEPGKLGDLLEAQGEETASIFAAPYWIMEAPFTKKELPEWLKPGYRPQGNEAPAVHAAPKAIATPVAVTQSKVPSRAAASDLIHDDSANIAGRMPAHRTYFVETLLAKAGDDWTEQFDGHFQPGPEHEGKPTVYIDAAFLSAASKGRLREPAH